MGIDTQRFSSQDGTAGIGAQLAGLSGRGGRVYLPVGRYEIEQSVEIDAPCIRLEGEVWSYSSDPNGVFASKSGTQLWLTRDIPAVRIGVTHTAEGCLLQNFGVQGNIKGMDTRPLFGRDGLAGSCGLQFANTRVDQAEFSKLTFCGLACGIKVERGAEIDACTFEKFNTDGCAVGVWFTPRAAFYPMFRKGLFADNPYYGFYADGTGIEMHNLELIDNLFIRNGGAFVDGDGLESAAVLWNNVDNSLLRDNLFDCAGTFWYYPEEADKNEQRQPHRRKTKGLVVRGNGNRIIGNVFINSSDAAIHIRGNGNVLLNNIADADVIVEGRGNQVEGMVFTKPGAKLIYRD